MSAWPGFGASRIAVSPSVAAPIQAKRSAGAPAHALEDEANRVSEQLTRTSNAALPRELGSAEMLRTAGPSAAGTVVRSPGQPLDAKVRSFMEPRFGRDFRQVRVHTDERSAASARAIDALAYTVGHDVVFDAGRYQPGTLEGDRLLAHELTHVVQQSSGGGIARGIQRAPKPSPQQSLNLKRAGGDAVTLSNGTMSWEMFVVDGGKAVVMSIVFTPKAKHSGQTITFLQTIEESGSSSADTELDVYTYGKRGEDKEDIAPFYGASWNNTTKRWEIAGAFDRFKNQPGGTADPKAYFADMPVIFPGQKRMFQTAVVVPETTEVLAFIKWGVERDDDGDTTPILPPASEPSDRPTAGFLVAVDKFYGKPSNVGPDLQRPERYDAILDRFPVNGATLTPDQKKSLDPIAAQVKAKNDPTMYVSVTGFADATEKDPTGISEARAKAVETYLLAQGVPRASILLDGFFGAAWARFPPGPKEERNRRVQVRLRWGPPRKP